MAQATIEQMMDEAVNAAVQRAVAKCYEKVEKEILPKAVAQSKLELFPVGSYWITEGSQNPGNLFGGTWKRKGGGRCLWGADDAHLAGSEIAPGLPNITGTAAWQMMAKGNYLNVSTGAFYHAGASSNERSRSGGSVTGPIIGFDASRSNALYGKSSTVQPPALAVNIWVRVS